MSISQRNVGLLLFILVFVESLHFSKCQKFLEDSVSEVTNDEIAVDQGADPDSMGNVRLKLIKAPLCLLLRSKRKQRKFDIKFFQRKS